MKNGHAVVQIGLIKMTFSVSVVFPQSRFWSDSAEKKKRRAGKISAREHCETKTSFA